MCTQDLPTWEAGIAALQAQGGDLSPPVFAALQA